jgi:sRNA-binding carbon storage regulator CsrA
MGYLVLSRREGEQIRLTVAPGADPETLLKQLLKDGITISVGEIAQRQVKIGIHAPKEVLVMRDELF